MVPCIATKAGNDSRRWSHFLKNEVTLPDPRSELIVARSLLPLLLSHTYCTSLLSPFLILPMVTKLSLLRAQVHKKQFPIEIHIFHLFIFADLWIREIRKCYSVVLCRSSHHKKTECHGIPN